MARRPDRELRSDGIVGRLTASARGVGLPRGFAIYRRRWPLVLPFVLVVVFLASVAHYYDGRAFVPVIAAGFFIYSWQYDLW